MNSKKNFTSNNHTNAWKYYEIRPQNRANNPEKTSKDFCIYHKAYGTYTYSQAWIDFLISEISDDGKFEKLKKSHP
jgi:hypothetical protein